jgi:bisphosphoglycerate-independent phosphoglycerate mutase (AlkP superfamily)
VPRAAAARHRCKLEGALIITADHGNADEMYEFDKKSGTFKTNAAGQRAAKTSHTLNPVPCHVYAPVLERVNGLRMADVHAAGLASVAATSLFLLVARWPNTGRRPGEPRPRRIPLWLDGRGGTRGL